MTKIFLKKPFIVRLLFALALCSVSLLLQYKFKTYLPGRYILLYPILFFISWSAGFYPAIISILFCSIFSNIIFNPKVPFFNSIEVMKTSILAFFSFTIAAVIEQTRRQENRLTHKLEKSSRELSSIIEGMQDAFFAVDRDWKIVMVNKNYEKLTLVSREDSIDHFVWEIFPEAADENSIFRVEANKVMVSGTPSEFETYYPPMDAWIEARIYPKDNGIALFFRNISKRKMAENNLAFSEKRFRFLADAMPQIVFISAHDGTPEYLNDQWYDYSGIQKKEGVIYDWRTIIHPSYTDKVLHSYNEHLVSGEPWEEIFPIQQNGGQYKWFLSRATPIKNEVGKILRWFGTSTDIDVQIRIEAELSESQNNFKQLADSIPHIVWTTTGIGRLDFYNARFYEYTGFKQGDEIDQTWESIIHPDDYIRDHECWCNSLETSVPYHIEYRLKNKEGIYRWFLGLALPVKDNKGKTIKWFGSCTDIEDQKQLASSIEKQNAALENALKARDEFLSIASHELKTPLTSLRLHSQHFRRGVKRGNQNAYSPERIDGLASQVEKQVSKLNRLVDDMLDISRIRTGSLTLKPQIFQLSDLLDEVHEILRDQFISSNCPAPVIENNCGNIQVNWDKIRIEQVLINLFTNAIRYGEGKQIILTTAIIEKTIFINVKDHGIGIAEENLDKIFNRFEKIPNPSEVSGLGLGLFISKQIIDAHAGKLSVESKLGAGSVFKIELPL